MKDHAAPPPPAEALSPADVYAQAVRVDWSKGCPDEWQSYEAAECNRCGHVRVTDVPESGEPCDTELDDGSRCDGEMIHADGPMMSYAWPITLDHDTESAAESVARLPVCIVEHEEHGTLLALTGGGMDLSWELCEAYMRLWLLPPLNLCALPRMAGRGGSDADRRIIEACTATLTYVIHEADSLRVRLTRDFGYPHA